MKLAERYALACAAKISTPEIYPCYFPLSTHRYITIHASSGMPSKNYDYWEEVLEIVKPFLKKLNINIIQIGGKDDIKIKDAIFLGGKTSVHQTYYVLSKSMLHLSNDTFSTHVAAAIGIPFIALYGSTTIANHSPYIIKSKFYKLIESDRNGNKPSYAKEELDKTINFIVPEKVANSIMDIFDSTIPNFPKSAISRKSIYFGDYFLNKIIEYVPDFMIDPNIFAEADINIRLDYCFNESVIPHLASKRGVTILTNKPINLNYLKAFRKNIKFVSFEVSKDTSPEYIHLLKGCGVKINLVASTENSQNIKDIRFKFFEEEIEEIENHEDLKVDLEGKIRYDVSEYKSNKFIFANKNVYGSKADWKLNRPLKSFSDNVMKIPKHPDFWKEVKHFYIFDN